MSGFVGGNRRFVTLVAAALAVLAALAFVGRWERDRNARVQNARMEAVYRKATVDGLVSPLLDKYRLGDAFDCFLYHPPSRPSASSAWELCFDGTGRLVETIDRSSGTPQFADLHSEPSLAAVRLPVHRLIEAFARVGVIAKDPRFKNLSLDSTYLPPSGNDLGAALVPRRVRR